MLAQTDEARPFLDRIIQLESGQIDTLHQVIPSWAYVDLLWGISELRKSMPSGLILWPQKAVTPT